MLPFDLHNILAPAGKLSLKVHCLKTFVIFEKRNKPAQSTLLLCRIDRHLVVKCRHRQCCWRLYELDWHMHWTHQCLPYSLLSLGASIYHSRGQQWLAFASLSNLSCLCLRMPPWLHCTCHLSSSILDGIEVADQLALVTRVTVDYQRIVLVESYSQISEWLLLQRTDGEVTLMSLISAITHVGARL